MNKMENNFIYERKLQTLARVDLLIIDDFGLKPLRAPEDEDFHDLIAERYERTATLLTSNLDFTEWGEAFATNRMQPMAIKVFAYRNKAINLFDISNGSLLIECLVG